MATTNFTTGTIITSGWCNDVDALVYQGVMSVPLIITTNVGDEALIINNVESDDTELLAVKYNSTLATAAASAIYTRSRGTAVDDFTIVQSGDTLARLSFRGSNGTEGIAAATISATVDTNGTPSATSMPGKLLFGTTADGNTSITNRLIIDSLGQITIGSSNPLAGRSFSITKDVTGSTTSIGNTVTATVQSDVTTAAYGYYSNLDFEDATFTCGAVSHFRTNQGTKPAGVTLTAQYGFVATSSLADAANNYGFYSNLAADGTNDYNFYASGTALNYFNGVTTFGTSLGYGTKTGVGGTVTQSTSKATGVTLNKICGQITTHTAALAASTSVSFTVNNSLVAATDVIILNIKSGATASSYIATVDAVGAGSFVVHLRNISGGSLSEAIVLNFAVIKAVAS